jgi:selenocysteine-specific elongation factor
VILGTAGHIDHGKTTLVRALTGIDTDRLPEEKRRGISIELGFAPLVLEGVGTIGVVDVPGHEGFVRTMVAGATGIDLALVVVAADEGVMPQTREHLAILEILGVRAGVVALTKADLVEEDWLALVEEDVRAATARVLPNAPIIATSATTGRGIPELRNALVDAAGRIPRRDEDDLFRMPIDRAFTIKGTGTVVTGTVWSGRLAPDDVVRILPVGRTARVRGIQGHGSRLDVATPGTRRAIALAGVEVGEVPRGSTIVTDREWHPTTLARADVTLVPGADVELRPRTWLRLHTGTSEVSARVVARGVDPARPFAARIVLEESVLLRAGDRFVLRATAPLNTIAGGVVIDPYAPRRARPWLPALTAEERLRLLVEESGGKGLDVSTLPVRLGQTPAACRSLLGHTSYAAAIAGRAISRNLYQELQAQMVALVDGYHSENPLEPGMPTQLVRARLHAAPEVVEAALREQLEAGALEAAGGHLRRSGWAPVMAADDTLLAERIGSILEAAGSEPPSSEELSAELGRDVGAMLRYLERRREVIQVEQNRYYTARNLNRLVEQLRAAMQGGGEHSPSELRDALGLSRKFLIPFLEYCDRVGYTNRHAAGRVWSGT